MAIPVANFSGAPLLGAPGQAVVFTDASTNTPTSWSWTFGDGGVSTSQSPTYTFRKPGLWTVALTATNASGSDTKTRTGYIAIGGGGLVRPRHRRDGGAILRHRVCGRL